LILNDWTHPMTGQITDVSLQMSTTTRADLSQNLVFLMGPCTLAVLLNGSPH